MKVYMVIRKSTLKPVVLSSIGLEADEYSSFKLTSTSKKEVEDTQKELSNLYPDEEYIIKSFII